MITVTSEKEPGPAVEPEVEQDIADFNAWFQQKLGNAPITNSEHAIIKTYLAYKLGVPQKL